MMNWLKKLMSLILVDFDSKIDEIKGKIPSITGLSTTTDLSDIKNKIPNISDLVNKTDYDAKIKDFGGVYYCKCIIYEQYTCCEDTK